MGFGDLDTFGLSYGGGESDEELVWQAMRDALGTNGAGPVDGIEDLARQCEAEGIACAMAWVEAAVFNAFPEHAVLLLTELAKQHNIHPGPTDQDTRDAIAAKVAAEARSDGPAIGAALIDISERFALAQIVASTVNVHSYHGRAFPPLVDVALPGSATLAASQWPAYSEQLIVRAKYTLTGSETAIPTAHRAEAAAKLNARLPSWVDFVITDDSDDGFFFDGGADGRSLLDQRGMQDT